MSNLQSWGRFPKTEQQVVRFLNCFQSLPVQTQSILPYGLGRSYGDSCLNDGNVLIATDRLDKFIGFSQETGVLVCEAGVSLADILKVVVPKGWFLPVTPGTKFVTIGGAIANDIHGKNHHRDGTFGHHVLGFELLRSSGERVSCSPTENTALFKATIGGLGLTGLIVSAEIQLKKIASCLIDQDIIKFRGLDEFFQISASSEKSFTYTVSWIDCLGKGANFGRGLFMRGNHAEVGPLVAERRGLPKTVPFDFPSWALNPLSVRLFNFAYYHKQMAREIHVQTHFDPFFYPLDGVHHWNRIYGKRGFLQWQCVVPFENGPALIADILERIVNSGMASFLAVLKTFGKMPSVGMLSFPREGVTLALDFPFKGKALFDLLDELDQIVAQGKGAIYAAKDARMDGSLFRKSYPAWQEFQNFIDPKFSSSFWRRIVEVD